MAGSDETIIQINYTFREDPETDDVTQSIIEAQEALSTILMDLYRMNCRVFVTYPQGKVVLLKDGRVG